MFTGCTAVLVESVRKQGTRPSQQKALEEQAMHVAIPEPSSKQVKGWLCPSPTVPLAVDAGGGCRSDVICLVWETPQSSTSEVLKK